MSNIDFSFNDIYIGVPDGETEAKNDMFEKLFCDYNNRYDKLIDDSGKYFIIGSKGCGKTYLAYYTHRKIERLYGSYSQIISANDFTIEKMNELPKESSSADITYAFCKWFILKKIAMMILGNHSILSEVPFTKVGKLKVFFNEYDPDSIYKIIKKSMVDENSFATETASSGGINTNAKFVNYSGSGAVSSNIGGATKVSYDYEKKKFHEVLETLETLVLKALSKKERYYLIIDDLDELDRTFLGQYETNITLNMIKATKNLNSDFLSKSLRVKTILLLRTDVLNRLQMYDMNLSKIITSAGIELYWLNNTAESPETHPLMKMILHKIKTSCRKFENCSYKEMFTLLFPESIDGKPPLDYLLDYSFGRPRDIITYLNHVIEQYPNSNCFKATELKEVRKLYSSDLFNELVNQAYYHRRPEYTNDCINLVTGLKRVSFQPDQIKLFYEENKDKYPNIDNLDEALSFLYRMSVIGNVWSNRNKYKTSWYYRKDSLDDIDLTKKMTIHYGLRKKFAMN